MRGKLVYQLAGHAADRITPARAGKTVFHVKRNRFRVNHPRACGENSFSPSFFHISFQSPPRVRGKPSTAQSAPIASRITPARAGKTYNRRLVCLPLKDHPRACGENRPRRYPLPAPLGSPPRVRGKQLLILGIVAHAGITPARAGKTWTATWAKSMSGDHPRACGENLWVKADYFMWKGSPPRVRGKPRYTKLL